MKILIKIIWWIYNNQVKIIIGNNIQTIKQVSIDKDGNVNVGWYDDIYSATLKTAKVNVVEQAAHSHNIQGVFTSEYEANVAAKEWFNEERRERIEQLEKELTKLKKEYNEALA